MSWRMNRVVKLMTHGSTGLRLNANEKLVLLTLSDYYHDEDGHARVGMEKLALETACQVRSLRRILRRLEVLHRVLVVTISTGRGRANEYRFSMQSGLFGSVENPVQDGGNREQNEPEKRTLGPRILRSADPAGAKPGPGGPPHGSTVNTKTPYSPPEGDHQTPRVLNAPSYLLHSGEWIEVFMGRTQRLFTRQQWSAMAGIHSSRLLEIIQSRGYRARIVPREEVATWKTAAELEEKTA